MNSLIKKYIVSVVFIVASYNVQAQILFYAEPTINPITMTLDIQVKNITDYPVTIYMKRSGNPNESEVLIHYYEGNGNILFTDNWTFSNRNFLVLQPNEVKVFECGLIKNKNKVRITVVILDYWVSYSDEKYQLHSNSFKKRIELPLSIQDKLLE